jgi:integrase/recombinase XerC/integrase/recombinase XerD
MRWEEMPKGQTNLAELVRQFESNCRLEGKPETTCSWYHHILARYLEWAGEVCLEDFTLESVREYLSYARTRPRYEGHPTTPSNGQAVSAYTYRHHTVVLRVFARWLETEEYTAEHRLKRLKAPKVPETIVDILTAEEIRKILDFAPPRTPIASRNHAMLVLALDTGMRMSEILTLERRNLDIDQGILTAFGKGAKERMVPFGFMASKSLQRYLLHFRPEPALPQFDYVFLQENGWPATKAVMAQLAKRVARKTGVSRFHWHLLRHTFAVNYLVNGGDPFSLQRILGHTTLEMVRRYMHLADFHVRLQHRRYSPMDVMAAARGKAPKSADAPKRLRLVEMGGGRRA